MLESAKRLLKWVIILTWTGRIKRLNPILQVLLEHNAKVYIASRSEAKADAAIKELRQLTGKEPLFLQLDLASLSSVRKAANEFLQYVYVNNGIFYTFSFCAFVGRRMSCIFCSITRMPSIIFQKLWHIVYFSGVMICPIELLSEEGYDLQFGTNVIGMCNLISPTEAPLTDPYAFVRSLVLHKTTYPRFAARQEYVTR